MVTLGLSVFLWAVALAWLGLLVWGPFRPGRGATLEPDLRSSLASPVPRVSIIVAARDEEKRVLRASIESMVLQDYPDFEVICVDDRSTDGTLGILQDMAQRYPRLKVIQGKAPPPGWLGKPNALQQALEAADGEWILATDADITLHPAALRTALAAVVSAHKQVLTLWPAAECRGFWGKLMMLAMLTTVRAFLRAASGPNSGQLFTIGGFILAPRAAFGAIGGYARVKDELQDDVALGQHLEETGYRVRALEAPRLVKARWYSSFRESWEGHQKHLFCTIGYSAAKTIAAAVSFPVLMVMPSAIVLGTLFTMAVSGSGNWPDFLLPALLACVAMVYAHLVTLRQNAGIPWPYALLVSAGYALFIVMLLVVIWKMKSGQGVTWKGRRICVG